LPGLLPRRHAPDKQARPAPGERYTDDERRQILGWEIQARAARGGRLELREGESAVIVYGRPCNHLLHLLLSVFTLGIWAIVWLWLALTGGERREFVHVDESGETIVRRL